MLIKGSNVRFAVKVSVKISIFEITKTFIPGKNPISANIVQLVLQVEGIMQCTKEIILDIVENNNFSI